MSRWPEQTVLERFESKVTFDGIQMPHMGESRCYGWLGTPNKYTGRAMFTLDNDTVAASKASWLLYVGDIPNGLWALHYCNNILCTRIEHLYISTPAQNAADRIASGNNSWLNKVACPQGHPYSGSNLVIWSDGVRRCKTCRTQCNNTRRAKKKALCN